MTVAAAHLGDRLGRDAEGHVHALGGHQLRTLVLRTRGHQGPTVSDGDRGRKEVLLLIVKDGDDANLMKVEPADKLPRGRRGVECTGLRRRSHTRVSDCKGSGGRCGLRESHPAQHYMMSLIERRVPERPTTEKFGGQILAK